MTKYLKLDHLESGWMKEYLLKKHKEGIWITRYLDKQTHERAIARLFHPTLLPEHLTLWMKIDLDPHLRKKIEQARRARRMRHFKAQQLAHRKKSIDITEEAWQTLRAFAVEQKLTLSEAIQALLNFWKKAIPTQTPMP